MTKTGNEAHFLAVDFWFTPKCVSGCPGGSTNPRIEELECRTSCCVAAAERGRAMISGLWDKLKDILLTSMMLQRVSSAQESSA